MKRFTRKMLVVAFTVAWAAGPSFPSIVCALTLPSESSSNLIEMPDCHHASTEAASTDGSTTSRRACCEDVATSCCLRSLDVDGAVSGLLAIDSTAAAIVVAELPTPASLPPSLSVLVSDTRVHSPPGNHFRVLRL